jgi:4-carboxymuconolactone decarboxylase
MSTNERREAGMARMKDVYGWNVDPDQIEGPYVDVTVDHLFGEVWTRPELDLRDRRLITIGATAALGQPDLLEIQFTAALDNGELDEVQLREMVLHLAHYIGWPLSTGVNQAVEKVIARRRKAAESKGEAQ